MIHTKRIVLGIALFESMFALIAVILAWFFEVPLASQFRSDPWQFLVGALAAAPLVVGFIVTYHSKASYLQRIQRILNQFLLPLLRDCSLLDLAMISLSAGIGEEMLFRGYLQAQLDQWTGNAWIALAVASVLFGLAHSATIAYAVIASIIGALLGLLWIYTGGLWAPIVMHAAYDFFALAYSVSIYRRMHPPLSRFDVGPDQRADPTPADAPTWETSSKQSNTIDEDSEQDVSEEPSS